MNTIPVHPGKVAFIGSGETSHIGGLIYEHLAADLPKPLNISVLETPAGFELNSHLVAGRVADYMAKRLQNHDPVIHVIAARNRNTPFSPEDDDTIEPVWYSDFIFMGPGSPTYAVRQLNGSKLWQVLKARHRLGASLVLASAATIALSRYCLPVYEIYKAGEDLHWQAGLDFFSFWGLPLVIIPHWNNTDGGEELDTSRCFMGKERFETLVSMLPEPSIILGIDEHTGVIFDFDEQCISVHGKGSAHIINSEICDYPKGSRIPFNQVVNYRAINSSSLDDGIRPDVWKRALETADGRMEHGNDYQVPQEVIDIVNERELARTLKDWERSDALRLELARKGWQIKDTPSGPVVEQFK